MEMIANGATVHYELTGTGENRVVLLHGWGCSTELMKPVADHLSSGMTVLNIDFPGHGKSGRPPEPWGVPQYAACLLDLLKQLDFCPCAVIAHSFGARVTALIASEHHDVFSKIILTGAAGIRKPQTEQGKKRSEEFQKKKKIAQLVRKTKLLSGVADVMEEKLRQKYGSADYNALDEQMRKTFVKVVNQDLTECYAQIQQPTLLIWGDQDEATPLWMAQKMEKMIPDAGLAVLQGGTHFAYLEQLGRFLQITDVFLKGE